MAYMRTNSFISTILRIVIFYATPFQSLTDNYPVELQFHTPGSLELKNEDSHLFYEALRDPEMTK